MENTNNNMSKLDVSSLNDVDLAQQLRDLGADVGPITNSTRAVYQRKLDRLLKYGSSDIVPANLAESSTSSQFELPNDQPADEPVIKYTATKQSSRNIMRPDESEFVSMSSNLDHLEDESPAKVRDHKVKDVSNQVVADNVQGITQEDIELVHRVMANGSHSSGRYFSSYQTTLNKELKRAELVDGESVLRSRYNLHNVTPRQSLSSYKGEHALNATSENLWTGFGSFTTTPVKQVSPGSVKLSSPFSSDLLTGQNGWLKVTAFVVVGVVAVLLLLAIFWNMEPAYSPLKQ